MAVNIRAGSANSCPGNTIWVLQPDHLVPVIGCQDRKIGGTGRIVECADEMQQQFAIRWAVRIDIDLVVV